MSNQSEEFYEGDYYNIEQAEIFLASPVPSGYVRWRCVLCGCPAGDFLESHPKYDLIAATCCGACGMACLRPASEFIQKVSRKREPTD